MSWGQRAAPLEQTAGSFRQGSGTGGLTVPDSGKFWCSDWFLGQPAVGTLWAEVRVPIVGAKLPAPTGHLLCGTTGLGLGSLWVRWPFHVAHHRGGDLAPQCPSPSPLASRGVERPCATLGSQESQLTQEGASPSQVCTAVTRTPAGGSGGSSRVSLAFAARCSPLHPTECPPFVGLSSCGPAAAAECPWCPAPWAEAPAAALSLFTDSCCREM